VRNGIGGRARARAPRGSVTRARARLPRLRPRGWSALVLAFAALVGLTFALRPATPVYGAPPAPDFTLPLASGGHGTLALRSLRGHPILLNFFQSDCGPCLDEMPVLKRTAHTYHRNGVVVLGISTLGDTADAARRLALADRLPFPTVADASQGVAWQYGVGYTPSTVFIDAHGRVQGQYIGQLSDALVRDGLAQAGAITCDTCASVERPTLGGGTIAATDSHTFSADLLFPQPYPAKPFALRDQRGAVVTPAGLKGKAVALVFLSALCHEQCPLVGKALSDVHRRLGRDAARFAIVAISVDPEDDTPYATYKFAIESGWQGTEWHYLTAPRSVLSRIWRDYFVTAEAPPPIFKSTGQGIVHDASLYLIDPRGNLRGYDNTPFLASRVTASVRALLNSAQS